MSRTILARDEHCLSRKDISANALKVLYRLHNAGFSAYLVGGGVRDLLLGRKPKDFDVATNAHPEEVRKLFRNSRLIGRRFRLAHIIFGRDVIEVATFRGHHAPEEKNHIAQESASGRLLRDNVYGTIEEDAQRRDFTINAIYYNIADCSLHDFADGLDDIAQGTLRLIGNPEQRYREDPVRMLRAVRFSAKLNLDIHKKTAQPILQMGSLLKEIPSARLFDESLKLFLSGHAYKTWQLLLHYQLLPYLLPGLKNVEGETAHTQFIERSLMATDARITQQKPANAAFLFAVFLWPLLEERVEALIQTQECPRFEAYHSAINDVLTQQCQCTAIPKRICAEIRDVWLLQLRMEKTTKPQANKLVELPKFRAAFDLLNLRSKQWPLVKNQVTWWQKYYDKTPSQYMKQKKESSGHLRRHSRTQKRSKA